MNYIKMFKLIPVLLSLIVFTSANNNNITRLVLKGVYNQEFRANINSSIEYIVEYANNTSIYPNRIIISSELATKKLPLLIVAQQQSWITAWQIPYIANALKETENYQSAGHVLCPNIMNKARSMSIEILSRSKASFAREVFSNPVITLKTPATNNMSFTLFVEKQLDFFIKADVTYLTTVTVSKPVYYYYNFHDKNNMANNSGAVIVTATSTDSLCMVISIQNSSCPVFDSENNVKYDSYWQTMTQKAGIVVSKKDYPHGFYIVMVVKNDNFECGGSVAQFLPVEKNKIVEFSVKPTITLREHFVMAISTAAVFGGIFLICLITGVIYLVKNIRRDERERSFDDIDSAEGMMNTHQTNRWQQLFTKSSKSLRSYNYVWHVGIVALFYTLPVLQLVFTYQNILHETGNQDLCYYNFLCAHTLGIISDFNHVFSNVGYVFLGFIFIIITYVKELLERSKDQETFGLQKPYGMFYALGFALIMEGVMSASYHICPKASNFQFDTSFMYVMTVLMMVNIYENRHSTGDTRGYAVFGILAAASALSVLGIYLGRTYAFWSIFAVIQILLCLSITWALDKSLFKMLFNSEDRKDLRYVHYCRVALWIFGNLLNWGLAAFGIYSRTDFSTHLLMVLIVNGLFYTIFYISMKLCHNERILVVTWVFIVLSTLVWACAMYFFVANVTSWEVTPAESRVQNEECLLLQYYDSHDVWHFLSSIALFFTFIVLLTLDEGIANVPRSDIPDFHSH